MPPTATAESGLDSERANLYFSFIKISVRVGFTAFAPPPDAFSPLDSFRRDDREARQGRIFAAGASTRCRRHYERDRQHEAGSQKRRRRRQRSSGGVSGPRRRFPPPWTFEDYNDACFIVKDKNGHALAYVYYEEEPGRRSAANLMTRDRGPAHCGEHRQAAGRREWPKMGLVIRA
jgi:hypothetical protein